MTKCRVDDCDRKKAINGGLCSRHAYRWYKYKSYDLPEKRNKTRVMLPDGIEKICKVHGELTKEQVAFVKITKNRNGEFHDAIYVKCKQCAVTNVRKYQKKILSK